MSGDYDYFFLIPQLVHLLWSKSDNCLVKMVRKSPHFSMDESVHLSSLLWKC